MRKLISVFFVGIMLMSASYAQVNQTLSKSPKTELKIADRMFAESVFYTAIEYYKDVVRQEDSNRYAIYGLAASCLMARDYENAEIFFEKFFNTPKGKKESQKDFDKANREVYGKAHYYYGDVLHRNGKYDEAIEHLNKFISTYEPKERDSDYLKNYAKLMIKGCEFAKTAPKAKVKVKSVGTGINKSYNEFSPFCLGDSVLYYSGLKIDAMLKGDTLIFYKGHKSKRVYQVFRSIRQGNDWSMGRPVQNTELNEDGYIVGNGSFNREQNRFYFTKCLEVDDDRSLCNIFVASYENGKFSNVQRLPEPINSKEQFTSTQPTVRTSEDGMDIVYFSSDMPGGVGGMDIWYFLRTKGGDFKGPKILKGGINTTADELTPFFNDSTKTLYFSSNGHPGFGGFDVFFSSENADLSWSEVQNYGKPINTGADELYFTKSDNQEFGFLTSNRLGSVPLNGIKTASDDIFSWVNFKYAVQGIVFKEGDETGGGAIKDAVFTLYKKNADGTKTIMGIDSSRNNDGSYFFKLTPESDYVVQVDKPGFQSRFEEVTTKGLPDEDTLNANLTVKKGTYVLYGEVTEEGKPETKLNNVIISVIESGANERSSFNLNTKETANYSTELQMKKQYKLTARKEGYFAKTVIVEAKSELTSDSLRQDIQLAKIEINKEYTLQNVLYEFNKSTLTENSKTVLEALYAIMVENPTFVIELSAHTDAIGSDAANLKLSQARAQSCVDFLVAKGIAKNRMVPVGYGESKPKVPNTTEDGKDDPEGRAINRRTEFKILKN
jgi:outer membrane protein OmpA-like peptidoglycan-associated protein/tetratricopeptide (TPR) repeat protein